MAAADIPLLIISENARSERRISPAWTVAQLKGRLEPITGIPVSSQKLVLRVASWPDQNLQTVDEDKTQIGSFTLQSYAELHVSDIPLFHQPLAEETLHHSSFLGQQYISSPIDLPNARASVQAWRVSVSLSPTPPSRCLLGTFGYIFTQSRDLSSCTIMNPA